MDLYKTFPKDLEGHHPRPSARCKARCKADVYASARISTNVRTCTVCERTVYACSMYLCMCAICTFVYMRVCVCECVNVETQRHQLHRYAHNKCWKLKNCYPYIGLESARYA
jgi:hypothetical protein